MAINFIIIFILPETVNIIILNGYAPCDNKISMFFRKSLHLSGIRSGITRQSLGTKETSDQSLGCILQDNPERATLVITTCK